MALAMPIKVTVKPSVLNNYENGSIPVSQLEAVDGRTSLPYMMASKPARGMRALHAKVRQVFGVQLSTTGRGRTFDQQKDLFVQRHTPVSLTTYNATAKISGVANKRIWSDAGRYGYSSIYWILKSGYASAAVPGTSPHGWFCADDICLPGNVAITARNDILQWLYGNAHLYGFAWSLTSEPWHLQWVMGDTMPAAVLDYEASIAAKPDPLIPPTIDPTPTPVQPKPPISGDTLMLGLISIEGVAAKFKGWTNSAGNFLQIEWVSSQDEYNGLVGAGALRFTYPLSTLKWLMLLGPLPTGDVRQWAASDFKYQLS